MPTLALLVAFVIALVLAVGFAYIPAWASQATIVLGFVLMILFAFTAIGLLGELMIVAALLGLALRGAAHVAACFRRHRNPGARSA